MCAHGICVCIYIYMYISIFLRNHAKQSLTAVGRSPHGDVESAESGSFHRSNDTCDLQGPETMIVAAKKVVV